MDVGGFGFGNDGKPPGSASKRKLDANGDPQSPKSPKKAKGDVKKKVRLPSLLTALDSGDVFSPGRRHRFSHHSVGREVQYVEAELRRKDGGGEGGCGQGQAGQARQDPCDGNHLWGP